MEENRPRDMLIVFILANIEMLGIYLLFYKLFWGAKFIGFGADQANAILGSVAGGILVAVYFFVFEIAIGCIVFAIGRNLDAPKK